MSENKIPEIVYLNHDDNQDILYDFRNDGASLIYVSKSPALFDNTDAYILKSKYDELEELRAKTFDEYMQLSVENARLGADLAKLKAELEKVKHENYILSTPISQSPLISKHVQCTCNFKDDYKGFNVICNVAACGKPNNP